MGAEHSLLGEAYKLLKKHKRKIVGWRKYSYEYILPTHYKEKKIKEKLP